MAARASKQRRAALPAVAVVVSRYNRTVTERLLDGAIGEYLARGGSPTRADVFDASGAFEIVPIALAAAETGRYAAVVALGCIIKGETIHDRVLAEAITQGLLSITFRTGVPVGLGVLTVETPAQAEARAGGTHGNKGQEAMAAALECAATIDAVRSGRASGESAPALRRTALPDKVAAARSKGRR